MPKYQLKGSTQHFTNRSVNTDDVTGYVWLLDTGSGYSQVATTEEADITFPDQAGVTCRVKLILEGAWDGEGTEVAFEDEYLTVEDVPAPLIKPIALSFEYIGGVVDEYIELEPGTGAGNLTWELIGSDTYGLSIDLATGHMTGICRIYDADKVITVKVTDVLGRTDQKDITISSYRRVNSLMYWFDASKGVTYDSANGNRIGAWEDSVARGVHPTTHLPIPRNTWTQTESTKQPIYIPDRNGFPCIHFDDITKGISSSSTWTQEYFIVCEITEAPPANENWRMFGGGTTRGFFITDEGYRCGYLDPEYPSPWPRGKFILGHAKSSPNGSYATHMMENGVLRGAMPDLAEDPRMSGMGEYGGLQGFKGYVYDVVCIEHDNSVTDLTAYGAAQLKNYNDVLNYLGKKHNIPVRPITRVELP